MKYERIEVNTTDGTAWLDRLTPRQIMSLGDSVWASQRKQLIQDMKDAEVDSAERLLAMQDHEKKRGLMSEIMRHAMYLHGAHEIIGVASKGAHAENAEGLPDNFEGTPQDSMRIALELLGAEIQDEAPDSKTKKKN